MPSVALQRLKALVKQSKPLRVLYRKRLKPRRRQWEPEIYVLRALRGFGLDTAIDIGANTGVYALELARIARRVIAFEPIARCAGEIGELGLRNVEIVNAAASDRAGTLALNIPVRDGALQTEEAYLDDAGRATSGEETERVEARLLCIDDFWKDAAKSRIDLIKIDVEGHELKALKGARETIAEFLPALLVEIEARHNAAFGEVFRFLEELGYSAAYSPDGVALKRSRAEDLPSLQKTFESRAYARGEAKVYINNFFFLANASSPANDALKRMIR